MNKIITLFHGSEKVIEAPSFGEGKRNNDFGLGFYCTETENLAKEWAVSSLRDGFCNRYTLDTEDPESEQPRLHHSQLDRRSCRASPVLHQDAHCKKSEKISD